MRLCVCKRGFTGALLSSCLKRFGQRARQNPSVVSRIETRIQSAGEGEVERLRSRIPLGLLVGEFK